MRCATRCTRVRVFPVPAPAMMSRGPSPCVAAACWAGLRDMGGRYPETTGLGFGVWGLGWHKSRGWSRCAVLRRAAGLRGRHKRATRCVAPTGPRQVWWRTVRELATSCGRCRVGGMNAAPTCRRGGVRPEHPTSCRGSARTAQEGDAVRRPYRSKASLVAHRARTGDVLRAVPSGRHECRPYMSAGRCPYGAPCLPFAAQVDESRCGAVRSNM